MRRLQIRASEQLAFFLPGSWKTGCPRLAWFVRADRSYS